jgi:hypothetical protein
MSCTLHRQSIIERLLRPSVARVDRSMEHYFTDQPGS